MVSLDKVKLIAIRVIENSNTTEDLINNLKGQANWIINNKENIIGG